MANKMNRTIIHRSRKKARNFSLGVRDFILLTAVFLFTTSLAESSLRLYNDSPFKLRAVIRAGDGTYVGEMIILPEHFNTWSDAYPSFGPGGQNYSQQPYRSVTPYTVQWNCLDGGLYGICQDVATGAAVLASGCEGPRYCKPPKKKKNPYGATDEDEQLHDQNELQNGNGNGNGNGSQNNNNDSNG